MVDEDTCLGVNASSGPDTDLITSNPLSELVWSQDNGLSLKYASSSLAKNTAPVLWSTETFNIIISSPQRINIGESSNTQGPIGLALDSLQLKPNSEQYDYNRVTLLGSPRSTLGEQSKLPLMINEKNQGFAGGKGLSNEKEECVSDIKQKHDKEVGIFNRRNGFQVAGRPEAVAFDVNYDKPSMPDCRHADLDLAMEGNSDHMPTHHPDSFHLLGKRCSGDVQSLNFKGRREAGISVVSQPVEYAKEASHEGNYSIIRSQAECDVKSSDIRRKEHDLSDVGDSWSISKERENSQESLESSNSKRLVSSGKRASSPNLKISGGGQVFKKQRNENSCSGSSARQHTCFMNWIASITKGYMRSAQPKTLSFGSQPAPVKEINCTSISKPNENASFKTLFQTLYHPSSRIESSINTDTDLQNKVHASKRCKVASEQFFHGYHHMICDNVEFNSCNVIPATNKRVQNELGEHVSSVSALLVHGRKNVKLIDRDTLSTEKLNQVTCQPEETTINIPSTYTRFHEKMKCKIGTTFNTIDMGSPSSSAKVASGPGSEDKGKGIFIPNDSSNLVSNRSFLENPWIKRLSSNISIARATTSPCNEDMELAGERLPSTSDILHPNVVASNKVRSNLGNYSLPSLEVEKDAVSGKKYEYPVFPIDLCGSKSTGDPKLQYQLNRISPSEEFKKSEKMASIVAKRLDAFRHMTPSEVANVATSAATTTCFFCGKNDHNIMECSEIDESDLSSLLKDINSDDGKDKSFCLCIRCFQLNHWAISCPSTSSKRKHINDDPFVVANEKKTENPTSVNHNGRTIYLAGDEQQHHLISEPRIPERRNVKRSATELVADSKLGTVLSRVVAPNTKNSCSSQVQADIGKGAVKVTPASSSSGENESKENQIIPFSIFFNTKLTDESIGIFETIRKLRMSRVDIMRWIKSPISHFGLEGFFLRLRRGKWEKDIAGTGYHVACIDHANGENSFSLCVGGDICLADLRSVSNHDFIEDELKAWWFETLQGGGKLPAIEELNKKLVERTKFGF